MPWDEVAPGVFVTTSARDTTTSTIVTDGAGALLVDPAWTALELSSIAAELRAHALTVLAGVATHAHHDHVLWHPDFGDVPRFASATTARLAEEHRDELVAALGEDLSPAVAPLVGKLVATAAIPSLHLPDGFAPELIVHDAHAPGHTAIWLPGQRVLIAGDMLSDVELPLPFDPDDLSAYVHGLDLLAPYVARAALVIPGHGHPGVDAQARLDADRRVLDAVLAGEAIDDPRVANPGMAPVAARLTALAAH